MKPRMLTFATCAAVYVAVLATTAFGAGPPPLPAGLECLTVELIMYSGRPQPRYVICEEAHRAEALQKLQDALAEEPAGVAATPLASTPAYQGLRLWLPPTAETFPSSVLIRRGHIAQGEAAPTVLDRGRALERYFLSMAAEKPDLSIPGRQPALHDVAHRLLQALDREGQ